MSTKIYIVNLESIDSEMEALVGGKAYALSMLEKVGYKVPKAVLITTEAYREFLIENGLDEHIRFELGRKKFSDMCREEMWDDSLRIQNMFITVDLSVQLANVIKDVTMQEIGIVPVVVRSSALGEDSTSTSFAGIREYYVNISSLDAILDYVRLLWASLWSDAALLYRKEIGLDPNKSTIVERRGGMLIHEQL